MLKRLAVLTTASLVVATLIAPPAHAADALLTYCPGAQTGPNALPASRNIGGSGNWVPDGFRSCYWDGRRSVRATCWGSRWTRKPVLNIINNPNGARTERAVPKDGKPRFYPIPSGNGPMHLHLHQSFIGPDATFTQCIFRVA